jgi:preprotein translocase subunit SecB
MTEELQIGDSSSEPATESVAASDIQIETIVLLGSYYRDLHFERAIRGEPMPEGDTEVSLGVNIQVLVEQKSRRNAIVRLSITARPEGPPIWEANAEYLAVYEMGDNPPISLTEFAWSNGIANLVPFIRERLASLTQASNYATYILPPISVARLRELHLRQSSTKGISAGT